LFLQNLLKKLAEIFNAKDLKDIVIHNFREIMIIIGALGLIVVIIMLFVFTSRCGRINRENAEIPKKEIIEKQNEFKKEMIVTPDDFLLPSIKTIDISTDYVELSPARRYQAPEMKIIENDYKKLINDTINDTCLFNFEKRSKLKSNNE
jgi:hypothetical protein